MSQALYIQESQFVATELYSIIKNLESSSWRTDLESIKARLQEVSVRLRKAIEACDIPDASEQLQRLRERLQTLQKTLEDSSPNVDIKGEWRAYRKRLVPEYEALIASLKIEDVHLPSLRPTNYTRNAFHITCGILVLLLIQHVMDTTTLGWIAGVFALAGWTMEISRRQSKRVNTILMGIFKHVAHPHEAYRINSSTWYTTGLFILAMLCPALVGSLAVIILGFSDPAAALVGRKFGRIKLRSGRSLEGTTTFALVGTIVSFITLSIYYPSLSTPHMIALSLAGAIPGAIAELFSQRIDDNLSIPLSVAAGVTLVAWFGSIPLT